MAVYNLYVSGILYGKLEFVPAGPRIRRLDVFTGELGEWEALTPEINGTYKSFLKLDFLSLGDKWEKYPQVLRGQGEFHIGGERRTGSTTSSGT